MTSAVSTPSGSSAAPDRRRSRLFTGLIDGHCVSVLLGPKACILRIHHDGLDVLRRNGRYTNARALSADLRATLGFGPALALLDTMAVPHDSDLYDLNQDRDAARTLLARGPVSW